MFFIGIFGIEHREKIIKEINNLTCKKCLQNVTGKLVKQYDYFHFFFIPLFKWTEEYYVICNGCKSSFSISKEKGKEIERGGDVEVTYWDLKEVNNNYESYYIVKRCSRCNREVEDNFEYCPYCGEKIR